MLTGLENVGHILAFGCVKERILYKPVSVHFDTAVEIMEVIIITASQISG